MTTLADEIACVRREVGMRERVYPRWVQLGRMSQTQADKETVAMKAVLTRLERLAEAERLL